MSDYAPTPFCDEAEVAEFYRAHPEWSDLSPEAVDRSFTFAWWHVGHHMRQVGHDFRDAIARFGGGTHR